MNRLNFHFIFVLTILFFCGLQNTRGRDVSSGDDAGNRIITSLRLKLEVLGQMLSSSSPLRPSNRMEESSVIPFNDDDFVEIPSKGASFMMGSPSGEEGRNDDEEGADGEQIEARFDYSFAMLKTEVTQEHWFSFTGRNPSFFKNKKYCENDYRVESTDQEGVELCPNHPVEQVSWNNVKRFIKYLNERTKQTGCNKRPRKAVGCYRLPTEAEWEFAARGGTQTAYFFGNDPNELDTYGWHLGNSDEQTHGVGLKSANNYGLFDMHGNVGEWMEDKYQSFLPGGKNPLRQHTIFGPSRVVRGGGWDGLTNYLRSAVRDKSSPESERDYIGFRLVKTL